MRNNQSRLLELQTNYNADITLLDGGAVVFYKNTMESDVIPFDEEMTKKYFLENFEMVVDMSKLQLNLHSASY